MHLIRTIFTHRSSLYPLAAKLLRMSSSSSSSSLSADEVNRYSRQLLMEEVGKDGQLKLKSTSVLIVGCGGLGCPAGLYLAAAGIGRIGLVDNDVVERSNLHRQVLHKESTIGAPKTQSAMESLQALNSNVQFDQINERFNRSNAIDIVKNYDIIIDATDNAMTRYLLSDSCVINKKPLVSGSALRFEGQLTIYNYDSNTPCYRCLFPNPPPAGTVTNCSDGGVLGVVPGIIGSIQALETIKIALGKPPSYAGQMLLFDALQGSFKTLKIRARKPNCISCGENRTIGQELMDYEMFCGVGCTPADPKLLSPEERVSWNQYKSEILDTKVPHLLFDVRPKLQTDITKLPHAVNVPLGAIQNGEGVKLIEDIIDDELTDQNKKIKVFVMCRKGIASQRAVKILKEKITDTHIEIKDIRGGLEGYVNEIDSEFPMY